MEGSEASDLRRVDFRDVVMIDHVDGWHRSIWHLQAEGEYRWRAAYFDPHPLPPLSTVWDNPPLVGLIQEPARNPLLLAYRQTVTP